MIYRRCNYQNRMADESPSLHDLIEELGFPPSEHQFLLRLFGSSDPFAGLPLDLEASHSQDQSRQLSSTSLARRLASTRLWQDTPPSSGWISLTNILSPVNVRIIFVYNPSSIVLVTFPRIQKAETWFTTKKSGLPSSVPIRNLYYPSYSNSLQRTTSLPVSSPRSLPNTIKHQRTLNALDLLNPHAHQSMTAKKVSRPILLITSTKPLKPKGIAKYPRTQGL